MFFNKKLNRVVHLEESEKRFEEELEDVELEKGDRLAMAIAGLLVFIPVVLGVLALLGLALYLMFFRFF